jgi:hypothetical protein
MANNLLPARAGRFARAYLAKRQLPVQFPTALASIAVERVFDGLMMVALLAAASRRRRFPAIHGRRRAALSDLAAWAAVLFSRCCAWPCWSRTGPPLAQARAAHLRHTSGAISRA